MTAQTLPVLLIRNSVYERLRGEILSLELKPGSVLQERDLAERYAVSKSPIRDALLRLEVQSLIEVMPRKGYRVRPISLADARDLYEMRLMLERACVMRLADTASETQLAALGAFRAAPEGGDLPRWIAYNRFFHLALAEGCGNARLTQASREVLEHLDRLTLIAVAANADDGLSRSVDEHAAIIDAVQRRDKRAAAGLVKDHVESSRRRLLAAIASLPIVP